MSTAGASGGLRAAATDSPDALFEQAMHSVVRRLHRLVHSDRPRRRRRIERNVARMPVEVCERLIRAYQRSHRFTDNVAELFRRIDRNGSRLTRIQLRNSDITDEGLKCMLEHKPREIELIECQKLSGVSLENINANSENLVSLKVGPQANVIPHEESTFRDRGYMLRAPKLKSLTIRRNGLALYPIHLLKPLSYLTYLEISESSLIDPLSCLTQMKKLEVLILYNVPMIQENIVFILKLTTLKCLDVSQSNERYGKYDFPNNVLVNIIAHLPDLTALDISGTDLAGSSDSSSISGVRCDIPGLVERVDSPLEFLGLYGTLHAACRRHDIPAKVITGDANENQILTSARVYMERPEMMMRILNDLFYLYRYENSSQVIRTLEIIMEAMTKHISIKHIQISGSATLFYIMKAKEKNCISIKMRQNIITALLNGLEAHINDETLMRNGCLTLSQFNIPGDVLFAYERTVNVLMRGAYDSIHERLVQRIAIFLLNSLACQVDSKLKEFLGSRGIIKKMLKLIAERLERIVCDDVMEVAWATMWNVTDETPVNSERFLQARGMDHFLVCLKEFPEKEELLRNMTGLLGNVAEVKSLRSTLLSQEHVELFHKLLNSPSEGIEVHYNAAGILANLLSEGAEAWKSAAPSRQEVLERIEAAIGSWDITAERNIHYRSFEAMFNLLRVQHTPQCQHWAVWALANLTTVYPDKYCSLVEEEEGLPLLRQLTSHHSTSYASIKGLALVVIGNCDIHKQRLAAGVPIPATNYD